MEFVTGGYVMQLTGEQVKQLHRALLSAFPKVAVLQILVRTGLNENLAAIAGETDLSTVVFALIHRKKSSPSRNRVRR